MNKLSPYKLKLLQKNKIEFLTETDVDELLKNPTDDALNLNEDKQISKGINKGKIQTTVMLYYGDLQLFESIKLLEQGLERRGMLCKLNEWQYLDESWRNYQVHIIIITQMKGWLEEHIQILSNHAKNVKT